MTTKPAKSTPVMLSIGAQPATITQTHSAIMMILGAPHADQKTKQLALKTLASVCQVNGTTVSNCSFQS